MIDRRLYGYLLSGGSAAVIDLGLMLLLIAAGFAVPLAAMASFGVAAVWNYLISARFVFRKPNTRSGFMLFLIFALVGASINVGVTSIVVMAGISPAIGKTAGIGIAFFFNYMVNRWIVFAR